MSSRAIRTDPELLNVMASCATLLNQLTGALVSRGEDVLSILPRLGLPLDPEDISAYSADLAEIRTQTDPYPAGVESLPTLLTGELERIRFQIAQLQGTTYWYEDPATTIAALDGAVTVNTANIVTNIANIAANVANIATNTANIATNVVNIAANVVNIAANLVQILNHAARHAAGGADVLPVDAINSGMILNNAITSAKINNGAIVNVDVNAAAAIAWSKVSKAGSNITDIVTRHHHSMAGLGDDDHPQYTALTHNEIITGSYTFNNDVKIIGGPGNKFAINHGAATPVGLMYANTATQFRIETEAAGQDFRAYGHRYLILAGGSYVKSEDDIVPSAHASIDLGWNNPAWNYVKLCVLDDVCSEILVPKRSLETLDVVMSEEFGAKIRDTADTHILKSEKLPIFLRGSQHNPDWKPGKANEGIPKHIPGGTKRNLTQTVSWLQGCVYELMQRVVELEVA